jgi:flagellar motor component MotA
MSEAIISFATQCAAFVVGSAISAIVLGYMMDKFVIKKIMRNKDVQDLIKLFREAKQKLQENLDAKNGAS